MAKKSLSEKRKKFSREYIKDFNASRAYRDSGYSKKFSNSNVTKLLQNTAIQEYLTGLISKQEDKAEITVAEIIQDLKLLKDRCMQACEVTDKDGNSTGEYRFDSAGANRSLELLGKHLAMFVERSELTINIKEVKTIIIQIQAVNSKHITDPTIRNRIASDLQQLGL